MDNVLYFECFSGISGDMAVAALIDLGADKDILINGLKSLNISGYNINISRGQKYGIRACIFDVILDEVEHIHRNINDIFEIIDKSAISDNAKVIAKKIFNIIAEAEAEAHGKPINEVHFHEVGAIDSIIDIVGVAICIDNLGIKRFIFSDIYEGKGFIKCQHGILPIPVPAVLNIFSKYNLNMKIIDNDSEMITPTGAGIAAALLNEDNLPDAFNVRKVGIGAGKKDFKNANILRVLLLEFKDVHIKEMIVFDTNIDDSTPEAIAYVMEKLFENGANDVFFTPIYMKKNRPAIKLSVICDNSYYDKLSDIVFKNLTTIGIRKYSIDRDILEREIINFKSSIGECKVKVCKSHTSNQVYLYPEYEDIKILCDKNNIGFDECINIIKYECRKLK